MSRIWGYNKGIIFSILMKIMPLPAKRLRFFKACYIIKLSLILFALFFMLQVLFGILCLSLLLAAFFLCRIAVCFFCFLVEIIWYCSRPADHVFKLLLMFFRNFF